MNIAKDTTSTQPTLKDYGIELKEGGDDANVDQLLSQSIKDIGVAKSGLDLNCSGNKLAGPLLVEVREYQDITQPKQRFEDDKSKEVDVSFKSVISISSREMQFYIPS